MVRASLRSKAVINILGSGFFMPRAAAVGIPEVKQSERASLLAGIKRQLAHRLVEPDAGRVIHAVLQFIGKVAYGDA